MELSTFFRHFDRAALAWALFVGAAVAGVAPAADGDLWWHMAAGREMVRLGTTLTADPFSVSAAGRPWVDVHWLFQLATYALHQVGGLTLLIVAKCLLIGAGALLLLASLGRRARDGSHATFVIVLLVALLAARHLLLARPVIVTLVLLAFFFLQLERFRREGLGRSLLPLALAQVVWANCQGLFALGPALVAAYALGALLSVAFGQRSWFPFATEAPPGALGKSRLKWLTSALALCVAASCATPFGLGGLALPGKLLARLVPGEGNVYAASVAENIPPFTPGVVSASFWHLPWYFGLLALSFFLSRRRLLASHLLVVSGFAVLALMANRNVLLFYWMASPILAMNLGPSFRRMFASMRHPQASPAGRWVVRTAVAGLLFLAGTAAAREPNLGEPTPFRIPVESARIIEESPDSGNIFAVDHQSGYLIWRLYPRFRPYIDTRLVLRSADEFAEYLALADEPERFDAFQRRHRFAYALLPVGYPDRYARLLAHLYSSADWRLVFTNGSEVLFRARSQNEDGDPEKLPAPEGWDLGARATTDRILLGIGRRFGDSPRLFDAARIELATLDMVVGELREAERVLTGITTRESDALRARCRLASGNLEGAEAIGQRLLETDERDVATLDLLAMVYARRGQSGIATRYLRRALSVDPSDVEATTILVGMEERHEPNRHER